MNDQILSWLSLYGIPVLFGVLMISAVGMPFPVTLMLVAAGSFVEQGEMKLVPVLVTGSAGAILGDQIGYFIGRWGGRHIVNHLTRWVGGEERLERAKETTRRWGGWGIFFSRWLITPLGPMVNLTSGMAEYPWHRFLLFDALGEILWVVLYVYLGGIFSDRVAALGEMLGDVPWIVIGLLVAIITGRKLIQYIRIDRKQKDQSLLKRRVAESKVS